MVAGLWRPLALSLIGCTGTMLGGLLAVANRTPSKSTLGFMQGWAAGIMVFLSMLDMLAPAVYGDDGIGFDEGVLWFFVGAGFFAAVVYFVREPEWGDLFVNKEKGDRRRVLLTGIVTGIGVALHNFPEGMAVYTVAQSQDAALSMPFALAVAAHNIPEGTLISLPILYATGSRKRALFWAIVSGLFEPIGVIAVAVALGDSANDMGTLNRILCFVAGLMTHISFAELLPMAFEYTTRERAVASIFCGMFTIYATIVGIDSM